MKRKEIEKTLQKITEDKKIFSNTREEAKSKKLCVFCKNPNLKFRDKISRKEYEISRICQLCQDNYFC